MTMNATIIHDIQEIIRAHISWNYTQTLTKYSYIDQWAFDFIDFTQNPEYQWYQREIEILKNIWFSSLYNQIIDLGPWNGVKWSLLMQKMADTTQRYLAIDISNQMLTIAKNQQKKMTTSIDKQYIQSDFDDITTIQQYMEGSNFVMMLWNTITNSIDMITYLRNLYDICNEKDMVVIGVEIGNGENIQNLVKEYNTPENRVLTFSPLAYIWVPQHAWYIDIMFNRALHRIEEWFVFEEEIVIAKLSIPKWTKILLSVTNKPTLFQLIASIQGSWFTIDNTYNNQEQYILCLWK